MDAYWLLALIVIAGVLFYHRASLSVWTISIAITLVLHVFLAPTPSYFIFISIIIFTLIFLPLNVRIIRKRLLTKFALKVARSSLPTMSKTEKEALAAGHVTWEADLFQGKPDWDKFFNLSVAKLTNEEQTFIDGPLNTLCSMIDEWKITHELADLPEEMWTFLREQGFFGLIIPKSYGGKAFSAYAHSEILIKLYSRSGSVASTVAVPNSLGPAELLLHYGTDEQKNYYLPRLARGDDIPCFALTGPEAGSDAGAMPDTGIVCRGEYEGENILGIKLNFNKRYITLAPVATVIGLAFKLYDPDHLIGDTENLGITCALIPRNTPNVEIGRRHYPLNIVFQNGPIKGKDVFIPLSQIIGGIKMAGKGWNMLMECLAAGRGITLPASGTGGAKMLIYASGAYSRVRRQFNLSINKFEGIEEALSRMSAHTYTCDAARSFIAASIDSGKKPAVASAIVKYHTTEIGRMVANDAMDIHGGKGICLGPNNYLGRGYQAVPIAITVEGANILTRNMIIFGQGALRCHPYIFAELEALNLTDPTAQLDAFDKSLFAHLGYSISNIVRSLFLSTSGAWLVQVKAPREIRRYFQLATRFSAAFALLADTSLLILGGSLKRRENLSARLGDILSHLYLHSAVLKHYLAQGAAKDDLPLVQWSCAYQQFQIQERIKEFLQNFPNRLVAGVLSFCIFPWGDHFKKPHDRLNKTITDLVTSATQTRARLTHGTYISPHVKDSLTILENAFQLTIAAEPFEKIVRKAMSDKSIYAQTFAEAVTLAHAQKLINDVEFDIIKDADQARSQAIAVDDFMTADLARK